MPVGVFLFSLRLHLHLHQTRSVKIPVTLALLPFEMYRFLFAFLLLLGFKSTFSQYSAGFSCQETVNAGNDTTLCYPGGTIQLQGFFSGTPLTVQWSPSNGLSDPTILQPQAFVSQTTTYTLEVTAASPINLVFNGDFESGNVGFTSDYWYGNPGLAPGGYSIQNNPVNCNGAFSPCGDHTSGSGNMMIVDGSTTPGQSFWCQTVAVAPNTNYAFECWVTSVYPSSPAIVQASFNGVPVGSVQASSNTCEWLPLQYVWNSGANTSVTICLEDLNTIGFGNDFAVDDIRLREICVYPDEVVITVLDEIVTLLQGQICEGTSFEAGGQQFNNSGQYTIILPAASGCDSTIILDLDVMSVQAYILNPDTINCLFPQIVLDGSLSQGSFGINSWLWTTPNGQILSNPQAPGIQVGAPGTYQLLVSSSFQSVTCFDSLSVTVVADTATLPVQILPPATVACDDSLLTLIAIPPPITPGAVQWTAVSGKVISDAQSLQPLVFVPGTYTLTLTHPSSGCTAQESVSVLGDTLRPLMLIDSIPVINCLHPNVTLSLAVVQPDSGFTIQWTTQNGIILSGDSTCYPLIGAPGTYMVVVNDTVKMCASVLWVDVPSDFSFPQIDLPLIDTLPCSVDSLFITPNISPDTIPYLLSWSTAKGVILSDSASQTLIAGSPGSYSLIAVHPISGCADTASILIVADDGFPVADAGIDLILNCATDSIQPFSSGSASGPSFQYAWTRDGIFFSDVLQPWIFQGGTYVLAVLNTLNGCVRQDTLIVLEDKIGPAVFISAPDVLDCRSDTVILNGSASDSSHHLLLWTGVPGGIAGNPNSSFASVTLPGWYVLSVIDTLNFCSASDSVLVLKDTAAPIISIAMPAILDCDHPAISLDASASSPNASLLFAWSTTSGNILSQPDQSVISVGQQGWYVLSLTNSINGCSAIDSVWVMQDATIPSISIQSPDTLTCLNTSVILIAAYQSASTMVQLSWTTANGNILSGAAADTAAVNLPGTYIFTVKELDTGCEAVAQVTVLSDLTIPTGTLPQPDPLSCRDSVRWIHIVPQDNASVRWFTTNGLILSDSSQLSVLAGQTGFYSVILTHPSSGCRDTLSTLLGQNDVFPVANAGPDLLLPCNPPLATLDGSLSYGQGTLSFQWFAAPGAINGSAAQSLISINSPGLYILQVTDTVNGCSDRDSITVFQDGPVAVDWQIIPPGCKRDIGEVYINNISGGTPPYRFIVNGQSFLSTSPVLIPSGHYSVRILDDLGCFLDTAITIPDKAQLSLSVPDTLTVVYGDSGLITLNINVPSSLIDTIRWNPVAHLTPTADPLVWFTHTLLAMQYQVWVRTTDGCEAFGLIQVLIDHRPLVFFPSAFSPSNADGINDRFFPLSKPGAVQRILEMKIFDRWGENVFSAFDFPADDPAFGWDGTFHNTELNPGVFVWVVQALMDDGSVRLFKGDVTKL